MKYILILAVLFFSSSSIANELLGKWEMKSKSGYLAVLFEESSMTQAKSKDMTDDSMSIDVKYVELKNSYGIELIDSNGKTVASMMAVFVNKDTISLALREVPFSS